MLATLLETQFDQHDDEATAERFDDLVRGPPPDGLSMQPADLLKIVQDFKHPHEIPPYNDRAITERMQWMRGRVAKLIMLAEPELDAHGTNQHTAGHDRIMSSEQGTSASYLRTRLKRDYPAIHTRLINGEFKSVKAAAREAGIIKPTSVADELRRAWQVPRPMNNKASWPRWDLPSKIDAEHAHEFIPTGARLRPN